MQLLSPASSHENPLPDFKKLLSDTPADPTFTASLHPRKQNPSCSLILAASAEWPIDSLLHRNGKPHFA
jgi:hypothetical protein